MTRDEIPTHERQRCEVWSRVMGYHRPVVAWNPGKRNEHRDRLPYREDRVPGLADPREP